MGTRAGSPQYCALRVLYLDKRRKSRQVQRPATEWMRFCNHDRPTMALSGLTQTGASHSCIAFLLVAIAKNRGGIEHRPCDGLVRGDMRGFDRVLTLSSRQCVTGRLSHGSLILKARN